MKTVSIDSASAAELETPNSMEEAIETGFLPDDPHYRLTGEFKKETTKSEKTDESAASTQKKENESGKEDASAAATQDEEDKDDASKAAASATANASTQRNERRESRWEKRERELRELRAENARLKAAPTERRSETAQPSTQTTQAATETAGKAAPKPKIDDVDDKGKPKFKTFAEYEDAKDEWLRKETIREFNESHTRNQQLTQQQQAEREIGQSLNKKFDSARAKYPDFDKVALNDVDPATGKLKYPDSPVLRIPKGSAAETFFLDSDNAGEVLYYCGQHPEILEGFYKVDAKGAVTSLVPPARVFRKLMEIEAELTGGNGDKSSAASSAKPVTQASRPPHQVSGKGTVAKDAVEQAVEDGDSETYIKAQNAKELARRKKA